MLLCRAMARVGGDGCLWKGNLIFLEGDEAYKVHLVLKGRVSQSKTWIPRSAVDSKKMEEIVNKGEFCDRLSLLTFPPRHTATGVAQADGQLLVMSRTLFFKLLAAQVQLYRPPPSRVTHHVTHHVDKGRPWGEHLGAFGRLRRTYKSKGPDSTHARLARHDSRRTILGARERCRPPALVAEGMEEGEGGDWEQLADVYESAYGAVLAGAAEAAERVPHFRRLPLAAQQAAHELGDEDRSRGDKAAASHGGQHEARAR